jgi:hypothetical protein
MWHHVVSQIVLTFELQPTQNLLVFIAQYSFPYVKKRIRVVKHRVLELSPIEVALDEMQMRVTELEEVVFMKPTDAKKLQLRLQVGTERVQVQLSFVQNRDWAVD